MRKHGLMIALAVLLLAAIIGLFVINPVLHWSLERSLETITGAKVEIDRLHLDWLKLTLVIDRFQLTNPQNTWRNLFETKRFYVKLQPEPLYSGKIVVDAIDIEELMINTPRKSDGRLQRKLLPGPFGKAQSQLNQDLAVMPLFDFGGIASGLEQTVLDAYKLETNLSADRVGTEIEQINLTWEQNLKQLETTRQKLDELKERITELENLKTDNILEIPNLIEELTATKQNLENTRLMLNETKDRLKADSVQIASAIRDLKQSAEQDFQALRQLAKLPDFETINFAEALFGKAFLKESTPFVRLAEELQAYAPPAANTAPPKKQRHGGQNISFPGRQTYPRLLIRKIAISGKGAPDNTLQTYSAAGVIQGITNEPLIYGLPLEISLSGHSAGPALFSAHANLDQASSDFKGQLQLHITELPLSEIELPEDNYLPGKINSGKVDLLSVLDFNKDRFALELTMDGQHLIGDYSEQPAAADLGMDIVRQVLAKIDHLMIRYRLESHQNQLAMGISSNIDTLIKERFKEVVGARLTEETEKLRAKIDDQLVKRQAELVSLSRNYQTPYEEQIGEIDLIVEQHCQKIEARRQQLEKKLQNKLESQLFKKIKL